MIEPQAPRSSSRSFSVLRLMGALALVPLLALSGGCGLLDDGPQVRGYTECGKFLGGETCSPGQYCEDPTWSECALGCLSDVNCASNQYCAKSDPHESVGVCQAIRTTVTPALSTDAGFDALHTPDTAPE